MNKPDIMNLSQPVAQQNATQIEFNQAMEDFKTMFPTMDLEVIEVTKNNFWNNWYVGTYLSMKKW